MRISIFTLSGARSQVCDVEVREMGERFRQEHHACLRSGIETVVMSITISLCVSTAENGVYREELCIPRTELPSSQVAFQRQPHCSC